MLVILRTHDAVAISARVKPQSKCAIRSREASMLSGFKQFILRGNVVDMAVGVVIGAAFATVVTAFTKDLLTPLVAAAVYFFVVTPINALVSRMRKAPAPADPTTKKCPECKMEVPIDARRCAHCTSPLSSAQAA